MSQVDTFKKMLENGHDSEILRYTLGNAYFKEQQYELAVEHLQQAIQLKPDYSVAWRLLGRALDATNDTTAALSAFDEGIRVATANGDIQAVKEMGVFKKRALKNAQS